MKMQIDERNISSKRVLERLKSYLQLASLRLRRSYQLSLPTNLWCQSNAVNICKRWVTVWNMYNRLKCGPPSWSASSDRYRCRSLHLEASSRLQHWFLEKSLQTDTHIKLKIAVQLAKNKLRDLDLNLKYHLHSTEQRSINFNYKFEAKPSYEIEYKFKMIENVSKQRDPELKNLEIGDSRLSIASKRSSSSSISSRSMSAICPASSDLQ